MRSARRIGVKLPITFIVLLVVFLLSYRIVFRAAGGYLVESYPPEKADAIVVLAGDWRGERIKLAGELVEAGYAPVALVSGATELYGVNESDLAIRYAVRQGARESSFQPVYLRALSTREEAQAFAPVLRQRNVKTLLLVTSDYHTHRAASLFRSTLGGTLKVIPVASKQEYFAPDGWWHNREGQKTVFYEYSKVVAGWLGM